MRNWSLRLVTNKKVWIGLSVVGVMKKIIIVVWIVLGFSPAAVSQFSLGQPTYGGSACLSGSASIAFLDGNISVLFDQLTSESAGQIFKKNCAIRFPILVSEGYQIRQDLIHATGFAGISTGRSAQVEVKFLTTGSTQSHPVVAQKFSGPTSQNFSLKNQLITDGNNTWSPCGQRNINLTTEVGLTITRRPVGAPSEDNFLHLDELRLYLQVRRCR